MLTPLGTNVIMAERLNDIVQTAKQKEIVKLIINSSNLALFHANDLLDF